MSSEAVHLLDVLAPGAVTTLVRGGTVLLSTFDGSIRPNALLGIFHRDERLVSALRVTVDGAEPPLLASDRTGASTDRIATLAALDQYRNGQALLVRRRTVEASRVSEEIELRSFGSNRTVALEIEVESDAASVLSLKNGSHAAVALLWVVSPNERRASVFRGDELFAVVELDSGALSTSGSTLLASWKPEIAPGEAWIARWSISAAAPKVALDPSKVALAAQAEQEVALAEQEVALAAQEVAPRPPLRFPKLNVGGDDHRWDPSVKSACADLEALVIDIAERGLRFIGAGAPWYQALFGRDSIIAAWQALPLGTELALDVLSTLASFAGTSCVDRTREAPGKIAHEWRIGAPQVFEMEPGQVYYGTVDASPLFVMLLAEAYRWGAPVDAIEALLPAARAALRWFADDATHIDGEDRGPFVWYTPDPTGLGNQAWKDSGDCMLHTDGSLAVGSLAVAEVQAYAYEAFLALARLENDLGHRVPGEHRRDPVELESSAERLRIAFEEHFWRPEVGLLAMAIDDRYRPLEVASSNMGQCLWSGILREPVHAEVARRITKPDLLSLWGVRTLGENTIGYNPLGYHLGTVWAHDSGIVAAGLSRHGFGSEFRDLTSRLLNAAEKFGWRLPELFGGLDTEDGVPLPYPASCSPQAWSAGTPLLLLRAALGFEPDVPAGVVLIRPLLAAGERLAVEGLIVGGRPISLQLEGDRVIAHQGLEGFRVE